MSHTARLYIVRLHKRGHPDQAVPFGDFDGAGGWFGDPLMKFLGEIDQSPTPGDDPPDQVAIFDKHVSCTEADHVASVFTVDGYGRRSQMRLAEVGDRLVTRLPTDAERTMVAAVFHLPRARNVGFFAGHRDSAGHSARTATTAAAKRAAQDFGLTLKVDPLLPPEEVLRAVEQDRVRAVKLSQASGQAEWTADGQGGFHTESFDVGMTLRTPDRRFFGLPAIIKQRIRDKQPIGTISYERMEFGQLEVTVELSNGTERTFVAGEDVGGHALAPRLDIPEDGSATPERIVSEVMAKLAENCATSLS